MEEDEGIRAHFPLSFGKQTKSQTPIDLIHNATRRTLPSSSSSPSRTPAPSTNKPSFPSLSTTSSSKTWLNNFRNPKRQNPNSSLEIPNSTSHAEVDEQDSVVIGPPRPPPSSTKAVDEDDDGDLIGPPPPPHSNVVVDDDDELVIGPPRPPPSSNSVESDSDDQSDVEEEEQHRIPLSNEIVLKGHSKVVSALAVDHSGSRVLSGSYDYTVRMYDFQGMNSKLASFRQLEPSEGHQVRSLSWSPTADQFLCVTGSAQAKIYDRDGLTLGEFVKGDMYIRDLKNTKGHITGLTCGEWHPREKQTILTSSEDGSLRIWDVTDFNSQKQ
ncbi:Wd repeat-containing protein, partial [Thalictrum thalictroides]